MNRPLWPRPVASTLCGAPRWIRRRSSQASPTAARVEQPDEATTHDASVICSRARRLHKPASSGGSCEQRNALTPPHRPKNCAWRTAHTGAVVPLSRIARARAPVRRPPVRCRRTLVAPISARLVRTPPARDRARPRSAGLGDVRALQKQATWVLNAGQHAAAGWMESDRPLLTMRPCDPALRLHALRCMTLRPAQVSCSTLANNPCPSPRCGSAALAP